MFRIKKDQTETTYLLQDEYNNKYTVIITDKHDGNVSWDIFDPEGNSVENEMLIESIIHVIEAFKDEENLNRYEFNSN